MPFSIAGFLVGRTVAERQGITDDAVLNRLSLLGGVMGSSPMGLVMTTLLAQREAENNVPQPQPSPPVSSIQVEVPEVTDLPFRDAKNKLESLGLAVTRRELYSITTPKDYVIKQSPEPKSIVSQGATVTLSVSLGSELPTSKQPKAGTPTEDTSEGVSNAKKAAQASSQRG
jgi:hypothetical protein